MSGRPIPSVEASAEVPWRIRDVAYVFLLTLLLGSGAALLVSRAVEAELMPQRLATAVLLPLSPILLGGVCFAYVALRTSEATRRLLGRTQRMGRDVLLGVGWGAAAVFLQAVVLTVADALFDIPLDQVQAPLRDAAFDPELRPFLVLGAVVLAPLAEELFFRGMAYRALKKRAGVAGGVVLSAVFFAVAHLSAGVPWSANLVLFAVIFLLGVLLAALLERRKSLVAPMSLHATFNLLSLGAVLLEGRT